MRWPTVVLHRAYGVLSAEKDQALFVNDSGSENMMRILQSRGPRGQFLRPPKSQSSARCVLSSPRLSSLIGTCLPPSSCGWNRRSFCVVQSFSGCLRRAGTPHMSWSLADAEPWGKKFPGFISTLLVLQKVFLFRGLHG